MKMYGIQNDGIIHITQSENASGCIYVLSFCWVMVALVWFVKVFALSQLQKLNGRVSIWIEKFIITLEMHSEFPGTLSEYTIISNLMLPMMVYRDRVRYHIA